MNEIVQLRTVIPDGGKLTHMDHAGGLDFFIKPLFEWFGGSRGERTDDK